MTGRASVDKGKRAERAVVAYLRGYGWDDARRYLAGDGRQPGDIDWHPSYCLEVKDRSSSCWPSWCRQAELEARAHQVPVVVRRLTRVTDVGLWEARLPLLHWADLTGAVLALGYQVNGAPWVSIKFHALVRAVWNQDHEGAPEVVCVICGNDLAAEGHQLCLDCLEGNP